MLGALRVRAGRPGPEERAYTSLRDVRLKTAVLPRTVEPTAVFSDPGRTRHSAERGNLCSGCLKTKPRQHPRASLAAVTDPLWGGLTAKGEVFIFSTFLYFRETGPLVPPKSAVVLSRSGFA